MKPIKSGTLKILGVSWKFGTLDPSSFARAHGADTHGICISKPRQILFPSGAFTLGNVRHELLHAYLFTLPVNSADLTADQLEEVVADLLSTHWDAMDRQARLIFRRLVAPREP